jgi:GTP-binding protein LepA
VPDHRGAQKNMEYLVTPTRVQITYDMPLAEIVYDFFDRMKS